MGIFDDLLNNYVSPWGKYNEEQQKIINKWKEMLDFDMLDLTPFRDVDFLETFLKTIPENEQFKYVESTNNYQNRNREKQLGKFNPNYVLVTRRAVPSEIPKPEQYWTDEHGTALLGLKREIPVGSPHRMYTVIMVTTLQKLIDHGEPSDEELFSKGSSDGEIMISSAPFSPDNFIFTYKPKKEIEELYLYIKNGGMSKEEVISSLKDASEKKEELANNFGVHHR